MEKQVKQYTDMNTQEKAQAIYTYMVDEQREALENLLIKLSYEYSDDEILNLDDWVESFRDAGNLFVLVKTAQESDGLDIDDEYVRTSIYYYGVKSSNDVIDLVDEDEAVDWIENALDDGSDLIEDIDKVMQIKFD